MMLPSQGMRELARRLLAERREEATHAAADAAEILGRLRARMVRLVGERGFEAILARSLKLAKAEAPVLEQTRVAPGGGLVGLPEALAGRPPAEALEASACLLA
jgi:hypothetical protein